MQRMKYFEGVQYSQGLKYASRLNPFTRVLTARDDIESMTYLILKLCLGELSWESLKGKSRSEAYLNQINEQKQALFDLRSEIELPEEIVDLLGFVDTLQEDEKIDYSYLKSIFRRGLQKMGGDFQFDWVVMNQRFNIDQIIDQLHLDDNDLDGNQQYLYKMAQSSRHNRSYRQVLPQLPQHLRDDYMVMD